MILKNQVLCTPFAWMHPAVNREVLVTQDWFGRIETKSIGLFMDYYLLLIFGGIPYQARIQYLELFSTTWEN